MPDRTERPLLSRSDNQERAWPASAEQPNRWCEAVERRAGGNPAAAVESTRPASPPSPPRGLADSVVASRWTSHLDGRERWVRVPSLPLFTYRSSSPDR